MNERSKVSHLRNYIEGHLSSETLLKLVPTADLSWLAKNENKKTVIRLWENYQQQTEEQFETAKRLFLND